MLNLEKINNRLQEVQAKTRTREFDITDVKETIKELKDKRQQILNTPIDKKYFKQLTIKKEYAVSNNYRYSADTTFIKASITRYGKISITVGRDSAKKQPYGGLIEKFEPIFE